MASMRRWNFLGVRIRRSSCTGQNVPTSPYHFNLTLWCFFMPLLTSADARGTEARIGLPLKEEYFWKQRMITMCIYVPASQNNNL